MSRPEDIGPGKRYVIHTDRMAGVPVPSNSQTDKKSEPEKEEKKAIVPLKVNASTRKKPLFQRMKSSMGGDSARSVMGYVVLDVIIPSIQQMVVESVQQGVERLIMGDSRPNSRNRSHRRSYGTPAYTRYTTTNTRPSREAPRGSIRVSAPHDFDEIVLETRGEAEEVLDRLGDYLEQYGAVTVKDLYDLIGLDGTYMDRRFGWTDLREAHSRRVNGGYVLVLPDPSEV